MKKLQDQLASIAKTLNTLSRQVDKVNRQLAKAAAGGRAGVRSAKAARPSSRVRKNTVLDTVFDTIKRSRKGISIPQLKSKTRLEDRQLSNALYKLTKKGVVKSKARGVYVRS
jgi:hypothetical protein